MIEIENMRAELKHENNRFFKVVNDLEAEIEYEMLDSSTIEFYHTYVPPELRGKGLAQELIKAGLDYAIKNNFRIIPSCSAVQRFINMHEEYKAYLSQ